MTHPEAQTLSLAPFGYDVHTVTHSHVVVTPKPEPELRPRIRWRIGPVTVKSTPLSPQPTPQSEGRPPATESEITVQLTADQQVELSITGSDKYGNPVDVTGDVAWWSSDDAVVAVFRNIDDNSKAIAVAVGPVGTAAVTVSNDFDQDGTGDFQGSIAIDVVAGEIHEILVTQGEVTNKPVIDNGLPEGGGPGDGGEGGGEGEPPVIDNTLPEPPDGTEVSPPRPDNTLPGDQPEIDNSLPGDQPEIDNSLPVDQPEIDNSLPGDQPVIDNSLPEGQQPEVDPTTGRRR